MFCPMCGQTIELRDDDTTRPVCAKCGWGRKNEEAEETDEYVEPRPRMAMLTGFSGLDVRREQLEGGIDRLVDGLGGGALLRISIFYALVGLAAGGFAVLGLFFEADLVAWTYLPLVALVLLALLPRSPVPFLVCAWPATVVMLLGPYLLWFTARPAVYWTCAVLYLGWVSVTELPAFDETRLKGSKADIVKSEFWLMLYGCGLYPGKIMCHTIGGSLLLLRRTFLGPEPEEGGE